MDGRSPDDLSHDLNAVLDWWREAGVDYAFDDAPRQWIVAPDTAEQPARAVDPGSFPAVARRATVAPVAARARIGGDRAGWPVELSAFAAWWASEPSLDSGQVRGRVPPRGKPGAPLMILVPEPEADDDDRLLTGPQGKLLDAMLAAMEVGDTAYIASALPRHTPMADWSDLAAQGLDEVLRLHVTLARPGRIIAFGRHVASLLATAGHVSPPHDHAPPQIDPLSCQFRHEGGAIPLLLARDLGTLLERPIAKGHFWHQWLGWTAH